jgi:cell division protein FtsZ
MASKNTVRTEEWVSGVLEDAARHQEDQSWSQAPARIKVVGVGGGGCNCVRRMTESEVPGVRYVMVNTDIKALAGPTSDKVQSVRIGAKATKGWGAGGHAALGERAAEESSSDLRAALKDAELVFVTAGMGGGTGTGAAPYVAHVAKEMGALVVGVVTTPFSFEGKKRIAEAYGGLSKMRPFVDNLIVIHNDRLLQYVSHDAQMIEAFRTADEVVTQGILSVSELINVPGEINIDFADVTSVMTHPGGALMAIGESQGRNGPIEAAKQAISNPLLDLSVRGAKGVLFSVKGGDSLSLGGVNAAGELIRKSVEKDASIFFGMSIDESLEDKVKLTLIATGLKQHGAAPGWKDRVKGFSFGRG